MLPLHVTQRLRKQLRMEWDPAPPGGPSVLGGWYATFLSARPVYSAVAVNAATLLAVVVPIAPIATFLDRLREAAIARIQGIDAPPAAVQREVRALTGFVVRPTEDRSVLGSLNNMAQMGRHRLKADPDRTFAVLGDILTDTPMFALRTAWPRDEAAQLLGGLGERTRGLYLDAT